MSNKNLFTARFALTVVLVAFAGSFAAVHAADDDWPPKVTSDGLKLVEGTEAAAVWILDGADFSEYSRVMIIDVGVGFKKNWRRDYNRDQMSLQGQVSQSDADKIKQRVADEFKTVFTNELTKAGYEVSNYNFDLASHDILVLRPAIMDLDVTAPDTGKAGSGRTFTASAGAMTLYLEFYDSVTSALLGRVVDRKADRGPSSWSISNRVTNKSEADRIFRQWAGQLIVKMDLVMAKPE